MGMSASQARFLSLTARKNNVEFEGQQINQQRTTLSNESASYYSELCNMAVPVPPSIDDYTKVTYTFNDGAMTNTLISLLPDKTSAVNNKYVVNYVEEWQDDYAIVPAASSMVETNDLNNPTSFSIGSTKLRKIGDTIPTVTNNVPTGNYTYNGNTLTPNGTLDLDLDDIDNNGNEVTATIYVDNTGKEYFMYKIGSEEAWYQVSATDPDYADLMPNAPDAETKPETTYDTDDEYFKSLNPEQQAALLKNEQYLLKMVQEKTGDEGDFYIRYVKNTTTGNYEPYLYAASELTQGQKYNNKNLGSIPCYSLGTTTQTREILHKPATVEKDASGRYVAITIELGTDESGNPITRTYPLTTTTTTDEEAYNDAMNEYNYKQHEYDHKIQEINSKLEIVQQQDKQLELKLKQLDTEENAISTEMDAVKKVISKNVESSFKTFNA